MKPKKSKQQRRATARRNKNLLPRAQSLQDKSASSKLPNEVMDIILAELGNVDTVCLALTCKRNYARATEAKQALLKELVPRPVDGLSGLRGPGDFRSLMRRLALWMSEDQMLGRVYWRWKRRWRKDISRTRNGNIEALRLMSLERW